MSKVVLSAVAILTGRCLSVSGDGWAVIEILERDVQGGFTFTDGK